MRSKKAIYNILTNLLMHAVAIVYGFIVPKIIIDHFGSNTNGLVASITQFLAYISLLESGFGPVIKAALYKPIARKDREAITNILKTSEKFFRRIALLFILYIIVVCFICSSIFAKEYEIYFTVSLVIIIAISTFAEYYFGMAYKLFLQAKQKTYIISIVQIVTYIISVVVVVLLALMECDLLLIKLFAGLVFILRPIVLSVYVKKKYRINTKVAPGDYPVEQKWDGLAQHIAAVIHENTDVAVLTFFSTLSEVSVYSVYNLVVIGVRRIAQSFNVGLDASFGDMIAKNEDRVLRKSFSIYESLYFIIITVVFTTTILLITPFVEVYTKDVVDANYFRPVFGALISISEFIWAIRQPYNSLIKASGHFRETRKGAWVECIVNIVLSIILVNWLGIIGVAVGTIVAMAMRTVEFVYHANKYILGRSVWYSINKIILVIVETIIIVVVCNAVPYVDNSSFLNLIFNALITAGVSIVVVVTLNMIFFHKEFGQTRTFINSVIYRKINRNRR